MKKAAYRDTLEYTGTRVDANLWAGGPPAAGCLYFHEEGMAFSSRRYTLSAVQLQIAYADIAAITLCRILGIMPNGLRLTLRGGESYVFAVNRRRDVMAYLCRKAGLPPQN